MLRFRLTTTLCLVLFLASGCTPKSPAQLLDEARAAAASADYRTASIQLRTLLKREPDNVEALILLADVALAGNNPLLAERNYRRADELGADRARTVPGTLEALLQLGRHDEVLARASAESGGTPEVQARRQITVARALVALNRREEAEAALAQAVQVSPPSADAHLEFARYLLGSRRFDEADAQIAAAAAADAGNPNVLLAQATRLLDNGKPAEAAPVLESALEASVSRRVPAAQAAALGMLAELDLAGGNVDSAARRADALAKLAGLAPEVRYLRARVALDRKDITRARSELQEILAERKDYLPAQRLLGAIYTLESQFDLAEMYLKPVVATNPDDLFARRLLATVHLARNRPAEALPLLENIQAPDPASRQALLAMIGQASLQAGDVARAVSVFREANAAFPGNPIFELGLGLTLLAEGRTDDAEQLLRQVRGEEADATRAAFLTIVYMQKGQIDNAIASAQSVVGRFPDQAWSHTLLGSVLMGVGRYPEARIAIARAVELDPQDSAALANLARVEELLGNPDAAAKAWQQILANDAGNSDAAFWLARVELERGNVPTALKVLAPFEKNSSRARLLVGSIMLDRGHVREVRQLAAQLTSEEPQNPEAWNLLGLAELAAGSPGAAADAFRKAGQVRPNTALYTVNLARALLMAGEAREGERALAEARRLEPDMPQLRSLEFMRSLQAGDLAAAENALLQMKAAQPAETGLHAALEGELMAARKRYDAAADRFAAAYAARPGLELAVKTWSMRREARRNAQPVAEVPDGDAGLLLDWTRRNPDDARALRALADAHLAEGDTARATTAYEKALGRQPDDLGALNNLAWLYQEGDDARALALGDRAVALAPDAAPILDTAGWAHLRLGDKTRGLRLVEKAAGLDPQNRDIQYHLAVGLVEAGRRDEGRRILDTIVRSEQTFASRDAAVDLLRRM